MRSSIYPKDYKWIDGRIHIWVLPFSAAVIGNITILFAITPLLIYFSSKGVGVSEGRKMALTAVSLFFFFGGLYACTGLYQIFVNEIYKLFIVRKAERYADTLELLGYYFKKDAFDLSQVKAVESFSVQKWGWFKVPWKNMMTLFNYEKPDSNIKITLKDGRTYYLSGYINNLDSLKTLLESSK